MSHPNARMTPQRRHELVLLIADGASYRDSFSVFGGAVSHHQMVWKIVNTARALTRPRTPRRLLMAPVPRRSRCRGQGSVLERCLTRRAQNGRMQ